MKEEIIILKDFVSINILYLIKLPFEKTFKSGLAKTRFLFFRPTFPVFFLILVLYFININWNLTPDLYSEVV